MAEPLGVADAPDVDPEVGSAVVGVRVGPEAGGVGLGLEFAVDGGS